MPITLIIAEKPSVAHNPARSARAINHPLMRVKCACKYIAVGVK